MTLALLVGRLFRDAMASVSFSIMALMAVLMVRVGRTVYQQRGRALFEGSLMILLVGLGGLIYVVTVGAVLRSESIPPTKLAWSYLLFLLLSVAGLLGMVVNYGKQ